MPSPGGACRSRPSRTAASCRCGQPPAPKNGTGRGAPAGMNAGSGSSPSFGSQGVRQVPSSIAVVTPVSSDIADPSEVAAAARLDGGQEQVASGHRRGRRRRRGRSRPLPHDAARVACSAARATVASGGAFADDHAVLAGSGTRARAARAAGAGRRVAGHARRRPVRRRARSPRGASGGMTARHDRGAHDPCLVDTVASSAGPSGGSSLGRRCDGRGAWAASARITPLTPASEATSAAVPGMSRLRQSPFLRRGYPGGGGGAAKYRDGHLCPDFRGRRCARLRPTNEERIRHPAKSGEKPAQSRYGDQRDALGVRSPGCGSCTSPSRERGPHRDPARDRSIRPPGTRARGFRVALGVGALVLAGLATLGRPPRLAADEAPSRSPSSTTRAPRSSIEAAARAHHQPLAGEHRDRLHARCRRPARRVARTSTTTRAEAAALPDVATFTGVIMEQVVDLEPDLVLAARQRLTPADDIARMRELGFPVVVVYAETVD